MPDFYEAALRSDRYRADPFADSVEETPGRPLAEDICRELGRSGYSGIEAVEEKPLWVLNVPIEGTGLELVVSLFLPSVRPHEAVWNVSVPSRRGFLETLLGRPENPAVRDLVLAVHRALLSIPGIANLRWFGKWPRNPCDVESYAVTPERLFEGRR